MASRVPAVDETRNLLDHQVVGNKADVGKTAEADTFSIVAYLKGLLQLAGLGLAPVNGPTYWVDYDLGADTNDGFSPEAPLKLLSAAITKVLAYQAAATNIYTRCRILLCGSSTPQPAITVLPNYCDIIGIGANPRGDGFGIARIGSGITAAGVTITATKRGLYFKNIQFLGAGGLDAFLCDTGGSLLRSTFEDCVFCDASNTVSAMNAGFKGVATVAGCTFRRCLFGGVNSAHWPVYGMYFSGQFSQNLIVECEITGTTAGIYVAAGTSTVDVIIRDNVIGDMGAGCLKGIDDDSTNGFALIANNMIFATDCIEMAARATDRIAGNFCTQGTLGSRATISEGNLLVRTT